MSFPLGFNVPEDKLFGAFWEEIKDVFNAQLDKIGFPYPDKEELKQLQESTYFAIKKDKLKSKFSIFANKSTLVSESNDECSPDPTVH